MRALLLSAAISLVAIPVAPVQALNPTAGQPANVRGVTIHRGGGFDTRFRSNRAFHGRADVDLVTYGGEWALYNNRSWESDSYNDWWHDRPERAYPRWMMNNQNCARMWWSGGGWRC